LTVTGRIGTVLCVPANQYHRMIADDTVFLLRGDPPSGSQDRVSIGRDCLRNSFDSIRWIYWGTSLASPKDSVCRCRSL